MCRLPVTQAVGLGLEIGHSWEYKMDALLTAEAFSGGAERRQNVAHGVSHGFPGAPHASPGGATENLAPGALLPRCRPCRGYRFVRTSSPRLAPWATVCRRSAALPNADCPRGHAHQKITKLQGSETPATGRPGGLPHMRLAAGYFLAAIRISKISKLQRPKGPIFLSPAQRAG